MSVRPVLLAGLLSGLLGSLILAAAAAVAAAASGGAPVVVLGTAEDEPLTGRIAAELRALDIAIEVRVVAGDERGIELEVESALREGARAAVRVDAHTGRTEVSIPDPVTRQVALRQVLEGPPTAALAPVLAVRTVEFVRATLLGPRNEVERRARGEGGDASPPDGALAGGPNEPGDGRSLTALPGVSLALDSGAVFTPGGLSTQVMVGIVARFRLSPHLGAELMGFTPLTGAHLAGDQTTARASTWLAGTGLLLRQPVSERLAIEVAAGALLAVVQTSGNVLPPRDDLTGGDDLATLGGSAYGRLGADLALSRNLALRLDLLGGGSFKRVRVEVGNPETGTSRQPVAWSRSFGAALFGVEARWF